MATVSQDVYEGIDLEITRSLHNHRKWELRVLDSPYDRPRVSFDPPFTVPEFRKILREFEALVLAEDASSIERRKSLAQRLGSTLTKAVMKGKVGDTLRRCLSEAKSESAAAGLRIRFSFGDMGEYEPHVVGLPWELMLDKEDGGFLSYGQQTQVVRSIDLYRRTQPLEIPQPLQILALTASPQVGLPKLDELIESHKERLKEHLKGFAGVRIRWIDQATVEKLQRVLETDPLKYHVLHFLGHGFLEEETGEGYLYFEDENRGFDEVSGQRLREILERPGRNPLRLAVLVSCQGAKAPRRRGKQYWAGVSSSMVASTFQAAVAMQFSVSRDAAVDFCDGFYRSLAQNEPIDLAMAKGRLKMAKTSDTLEWATPVLTLRARDSKVFEVKESPEASVAWGIQSVVQFGAEELQEESHAILDLTDAFDSTNLAEPLEGSEAWNGKVRQRLQTFLDENLTRDYPNRLYLSAQGSIACAVGFLYPSKSGVKFWVSQRGENGTEIWKKDDPVPDDAPRLVCQAPKTQDPKSRDLAVVVSLSSSATPAVKQYLDPKKAADKGRPLPPRVGHVLFAELEGGAGQDKVKGGGHVYQLAAELAEAVKKSLAENPAARIHLFGVAPNAFWVFFGRHAQLFGCPIQLYEFVRSAQTYVPSLTLSQSFDSKRK